MQIGHQDLTAVAQRVHHRVLVENSWSQGSNRVVGPAKNTDASNEIEGVWVVAVALMFDEVRLVACLVELLMRRLMIDENLLN